jgi:RNA polymerase sigma-70 factor (ECF subfamily)
MNFLQKKHYIIYDVNTEIQNWQSGNLDDFEALFRLHQKSVFRTAYLLCGSKEEAEDVLQEVFLSMWRFKRSFDPAKSKLSTWLHRITVNECLKDHHMKRTYLTVGLEDIDLQEVRDRQPEQVLLTKFEYERLLSTLASMDNKYRTVLVLRYFDDLPYSEIADIVNIPLGTVKSRINHALNCLKKRFASQEAGV